MARRESAQAHRGTPCPAHEASADVRFGAASRRVLALGPGSPSTPLRCVAGVRESAVEGLGAALSTAFPGACSEAECDPGPSARLCREAAPNSFRRGLLSGEALRDHTVGMT